MRKKKRLATVEGCLSPTPSKPRWVGSPPESSQNPLETFSQCKLSALQHGQKAHRNGFIQAIGGSSASMQKDSRAVDSLNWLLTAGAEQRGSGTASMCLPLSLHALKCMSAPICIWHQRACVRVCAHVLDHVHMHVWHSGPEQSSDSSRTAAR